VHEDKEITLKLAIEMSSLSPEESPESRTARGSVVARRTIETTMMVEEGDTQVLTGLVPLKGGGTDPSPTKTEMVLLVTTHVSRVPDVRPNERLAVWRGYAVD